MLQFPIPSHSHEIDREYFEQLQLTIQVLLEAKDSEGAKNILEQSMINPKRSVGDKELLFSTFLSFSNPPEFENLVELNEVFSRERSLEESQEAKPIFYYLQPIKSLTAILGCKIPVPQYNKISDTFDPMDLIDLLKKVYKNQATLQTLQNDLKSIDYCIRDDSHDKLGQFQSNYTKLFEQWKREMLDDNFV